MVGKVYMININQFYSAVTCYLFFFIIIYLGFWGFMMCTFFMVPLTYFIRSTPGNGLTEDFIDTWVMLSNNYLIIIFAVGFFFSILMFNVFGMFMCDQYL